MIGQYPAKRYGLMDLTHEQLLILIGAVAALITSLSPIMTTLGAGIGSYITSTRAAKRSELERLTARVDKLQTDVDKLETENTTLRQEILLRDEYIAVLRRQMIENDIDVPTFAEWRNNGRVLGDITC